MTTIVGVTDNSGLVVLGTDSFYSTGGWTREIRHESKLIYLDGKRIVIGVAGTVRILNLIRDAAPDTWEEAIGQFHQSQGQKGAMSFGRALRRVLRTEGGLAMDNNIDLLPERSQIMIAASPGMLFVVASDFSVGSMKCGYAAIGTGAEVALGSLHTTAGWIHGKQVTSHDRAMLALQASAEHAIHVCEPVHLQEVTIR